ncbi:acetyl-CoA synthetase-like protein [Pluteus cervinus]|uniref:Acetyl-CoA synthetase-like protein n=1 Tax=Pluteus cervinus TaxID=181527 RepID=A0ACD3AMF9_9AGAR|nr:acetyl-CoA synthetase-like protein [Pluteus cervinus]
MFSFLSGNPFGAGSVEVGPAEPGEGAVRRLAIHSGYLATQPQEGVETVRDLLEVAINEHGPRHVMGWRDIVKIHEEEKEIKKNVDGKEITEKKKWKYFELSDYKYLTYNELEVAVTEVSRGLVDLGVTQDSTVNLYASTSVSWQLMALGCAFIGTPIATAYDTLGPEGLAHSLNEPSCFAVFTNADLLSTVATVLSNTPTVQCVLYDGSPSSSILAKLQGIRPDSLKIMTIDELRERGRTLSKDRINSRKPGKGDLACIMYTSGSTGNPKGVCISHANLVASVAGARVLLGQHIRVDGRYLAYLPLAHVFEYIVELLFIFSGVLVGYGRNKTLTDSSVRNCVGDLSALKPNYMLGVPAVWETIRKGIEGQVQKGGYLTNFAFYGALNVKRWGIPGLSWLLDSLVLNRARQATGGAVQYAVNGGAAISRDTREFVGLTVAPVVEGYGMTETCGMCAILPPECISTGTGSVGLPVPSIEIKLRDVPEAGYSSAHNPPTGEILIRGPSVSKGYFKRPDLNDDENVFTKDGWLRTGDVATWNADGTLTIIDRIKNLVKLQNGEYIALERLESIYKSSPLVSNICVHANNHARQPIAIIVPREHELRAALTNDSHSHASFAELCKTAAAKDAMLKSCNDVGKAHGLKGVELLQGVVLVDEEWSVESGLVTAAMKIQRTKIGNKWQKEIQEVYDQQK